MNGRNKKNQGRLIAFGGVMAAVSLVLMMLTTALPMLTYGLPAICGVLTTLVVIECGDKMALTMYGAVSILSLLLLPSKEAAIVYILLFGWYPVAKRRIEAVRKPVIEWTVKFTVMAVPVALGSIIAIQILGVSGFFGSDTAMWMIPVLYIAIAGVFFLYDVALTRLISAYLSVLRPKYLAKLFK